MTELEKIIRPIVEGQLRGFVKEHAEILRGVTWYKNGATPAQTFIGSLSKRIVRDLTCRNTAARLAAAFLALSPEEPSSDDAGIGPGASSPELEVPADSGGSADMGR